MLKDSFIRNLENITWMDALSKNSTIEKLNAINFKIGYPDFYDEFPEKLTSLVEFDVIPGDYYTNIRRSNEHRVMLNMRRLQRYASSIIIFANFLNLVRSAKMTGSLLLTRVMLTTRSVRTKSSSPPVFFNPLFTVITALQQSTLEQLDHYSHMKFSTHLTVTVQGLMQKGIRKTYGPMLQQRTFKLILHASKRHIKTICLKLNR